MKEKRHKVGLQKRLQRYFNLQNQGFDFKVEIEEVKKEMQKICEVESKGIILRSRERDLEEGEKCSRYFFKKIVSRGNAITKLKTKEGETKANTNDIQKIVEEFYTELYAEKEIEDSILEEVLDFIKETPIEPDSLVNDFNLSEIDNALRNFKKGKSPGPDGLPVEFYSTFWDIQ